MTLTKSVLTNVGYLFPFLPIYGVATDGTSCLDVFNTEAHPFKAAPASSGTNYGTGSIIGTYPPFSSVEGDLPAVSAIAGLPDLVFGPPGIISTILGLITGFSGSNQP